MIVSIADELASVKNYLRIQRIRYGKLFKVLYSIDNEIQNYRILKLVLQPLAENTLYHGIKPKGKSGVIHISIQRQGDAICIAVEDNGVGMPQEKADVMLVDDEQLYKRLGTAACRCFIGGHDSLCAGNATGQFSVGGRRTRFASRGAACRRGGHVVALVAVVVRRRRRERPA